MESLNGWHWLILGIVLFIFEALGVGGILVGAATGAIVLAALLSIIHMAWQVQFVVFGVLAVVGTGIFWKFFRVGSVEVETSKINNRKAQMIGMRVSLLTDIRGGRGKVQIQDALWAVSCEEDMPLGTLVEVSGYDENYLHVVKV